MAAPHTTSEEILYWLALRLVPGLGARGAIQLLTSFHEPRAIFQASQADLEQAGLPELVARSIASGCTFEEALDQHRKMASVGAELITFADPHYPAKLRDIYDPPLVLFARGRLDLLDSVMLAIVGTRHPTSYGTTVTEKLAGELARAGLTIVSGMARGIDTAAHRAALAAGGKTVAVFGCGVDVIYPSENRKLAEQIARQGLIVSEFPMGAPAYPRNFPIRNRIISGLSSGVLVVEGAHRSGSMITARLAVEQGRELMAIPGNITSKMSCGPNLLIKQGAKLVQDWKDVVGELPWADRVGLKPSLAGAPPSQETEPGPRTRDKELPDLGPLTPVAREILDILKVDGPTHLDELVGSIDSASSSEIVAALFELELLGIIKQLPGRNYVKVW